MTPVILWLGQLRKTNSFDPEDVRIVRGSDNVLYMEHADGKDKMGVDRWRLVYTSQYRQEDVLEAMVSKKWTPP